MTDHRVTASDGLELFARSYGTATAKAPVVCVPGLTRNSRDFESVASALAEERLVVAVDLRGRGRSGYDRSAGSYTLDVYARDLATVVEELVAGPVVVLGTSLGGLTALWLGADRPELVRGIVLNDIGPEIAPEGAARIASYAGKLPIAGTWDEAVRQTRMVSEPATPELTEEEWLAAARQRYREEPDGTVVVDHDPGIASGPPPTRDPWLLFSQLDGVPMLLLRGTASDLLAPATVEAMVRNHPGLDVVEVAGRGHTPTLDEPVCRRSIARFLATIDSPSVS